MLQYKMVTSTRTNGTFLYVVSEKQLYTFTDNVNAGKSYRCRKRTCKSRVVVMPNQLCVKLIDASEHNHTENEEKTYRILCALAEVKRKCADLNLIASGKRMTKPRDIFKQVMAK